MIAHTSPLEHGVMILLGVLALVAYGQAWTRRPAASTGRLLAWAAALAATLLATMPAVERVAAESFTGHMAQHLVMIVVAAPLFVVARPLRTLRDHPWVAGRRPEPAERAAARWWRRHGVVIAPASFLVTLYVTHLTGVYEWALQSRVVHDLEHVAYLGSAVALWAVVVSAGRRTVDSHGGGRTGAGRVGTALAVIAGTAILGVVLMTASEPLVPTYVDELGTDGALDDQRLAASLMWAGGMGLTLPLLMASVWMWAAAEQRVATRREELTDRPRHPARP